MKKYSPIILILLTLALIGATLTLIFIANKYILTINFYERNGQPVSGIPDMESLVYDKIKSVVYISSIAYILVKVLVISIIVASGLYFFDVEVPFGRLLRVVVLCEFIFLIPAAAKICWFWQDRAVVDLVSWQNFYFLSAATLFPDVKPAFLLPLQTLNVFEFSYWFLLACGIEKIAGLKFDKALRVVCLSYIPALFIWELFVIYFTVVYFPQSY